MKPVLQMISVIAMCVLASLTANARLSGRVVLIPLDDRPISLQLPVRLGQVGDIEVVTPPKELLGGADMLGKPERILEWLGRQDLKSFDAAVISIDMVAYGGLVGSRTSRSAGFDLAKRRLETLKELHRRYPRLRIFATNALIRTFSISTESESFNSLLERWTNLTDGTGGARSAEADEIAKNIPPAILDEYTNTRTRNLNISLLAVEYTRKGILNHLVLGQDSGGPTGLSVSDGDRLMRTVRGTKVEAKVAIRSGVDEAALLHVTRAANLRYGIRPRVAVIVSRQSGKGATAGEGWNIRRGAALNDVSIAGGVGVPEWERADIILFVSQGNQESAVAFADEVQKAVSSRRRDRVVVADLGMRERERFDGSLTAILKERLLLGRLAGYAARDTADGTVGISLSGGMMSHLAQSGIGAQGASTVSRRTDYARKWFMADRILDDVVYRSVVRPEVESLAKRNGWKMEALMPEQVEVLQTFATEKLSGRVDEFLKSVETLNDGPTVCDSLKYLKVALIWRRTSEPELDFELNCRYLR